MFQNGLAPAKGDSLDSSRANSGACTIAILQREKLLLDRFEPRDEAFLRPALQELKLE